MGGGFRAGRRLGSGRIMKPAWGAGRAARHGSFREWAWDPEPADDWIQAEYEFTLRAADGTVQVVREAHRLGAFRRDTWLRLLADAGFDPQAAAAPESLTAESLTAESLTAESLTAESLTAESLTAESLTAESLTAESLTAESLTAESLTTECPGGRMPRNLLIGRRPR